MQWIGWRGLLGLLALLTLAVSALIYLTVPESQSSARPGSTIARMPLRKIYSNPDFVCIALVNSLSVAIPWAMQSLWAAPWLKEVNGYGHPMIVNILFVMSCTLCAGSMLFGSVADILGARGIATETVFGGAVVALLAVEMLILSSAPLPAYFLWGMLSLFGGLPALGFAIMSELFPQEIIGRISSALVMLNHGIVFFVQSGMGFILALWPHPSVGPRPRIAFEAAFAAPCALQVMAFAWLLWRGASRRKATAQAPLLRTASVEGESEILPP